MIRTSSKLVSAFAIAFFTLATPSTAQFSGPSVQGGVSTVAAALNVRLGSYVTLTGNIESHLRENYYNFRDETGELRVEISGDVWRGQNVSPTTTVRIMGEIDHSITTGRYLWVKSLNVVP